MSPLGARAQFNGEGGDLLVTFLVWGIAPPFIGGVSLTVLSLIGGLVAGAGGHGRHAHGPGAAFYGLTGMGFLIFLACVTVGGLFFTNKFIAFRFDNLVLDGQKCEYKGTTGGLISVYLVTFFLTFITFGIYTPWGWCRMYRFMYENTYVNGQPNRLVFAGSGAELLGRYLLGTILTTCTLGIYGAWFANDLFAFFWEGTKLDGRGFSFRKDPGGFLGTYLLTVILSMCTFNIYYPWGVCNILKWEAERVS